MLLPDETQFFPVRVIGERFNHVRPGVDELTMEPGDEVRMLQHDLRSVGPGLEVPTSLELEEVPLGADNRTRFKPFQKARSGRGRGVVHGRSPSFLEAPGHPAPAIHVID
jgi:hypothetical protein